MKPWQIILVPLAFLATSLGIAAQQPYPAGQPMPSPYPTAGAPTAAGGQPYFQQTPNGAPTFVQPTPQGVPIYPPGSTVVPLPSQTPGSIFGPPTGQNSVVTIPQGPGSQSQGAIEQLPTPPGYVVTGAQPQLPPGVIIPGAPGAPGAPQMAVAGPPNTISVPAVDEEYAWDQIADVVSDYFKIAREQRARRGAEGSCEGRIDTVARDSATWLEPHRNDSIGTWNRWESTFQTIRRRATVRVIPDANGYLVEVIVEKEREDLPKPERSTVSRASFSDNIDFTLPSDRLEESARVHSSPRWLSLGRDPALEQRMLAEIHARLNGVNTRGSIFGQ
jgi:hypothetical protein